MVQAAREPMGIVEAACQNSASPTGAREMRKVLCLQGESPNQAGLISSVPRLIWSRSIDSNKAPKLPSPKPSR